MDKPTNSTKNAEKNDNFANDVLPTFEIEDNPVIYAVQRNDKYYIASFGKILLPNAFAHLDELKMYVDKYQTKLIQLSILAYWYASQHNELDINKLTND